MRSSLGFVLLFTIATSTVLCQECEYESFLDAISGNIFSDTSIFKQAVKLSGYEVWFVFDTPNALNELVSLSAQFGHKDPCFIILCVKIPYSRGINASRLKRGVMSVAG